MDKMSAGITREMIGAVIDYDRLTGLFTWKISGHKRKSGRTAGCIDKSGYRRIYVNGKQCLASHLAWIIVHGKPPETDIDHRDTIRSNDAFDNLRLATRRQNIANSGLRTTNTSGYKGVYWCKQANKWKARIRDNGKHRYLGQYADPAEAGAAYALAASQMYGEFARTA